MARWHRPVGVTLLLAGLAPIALPLAADSIAHVIDGCAANEAGSTGCIWRGRDIGPNLAATYALVPLAPAGFVVALIGFFLLLSAWGISRAETRRAKHR